MSAPSVARRAAHSGQTHLRAFLGAVIIGLWGSTLYRGPRLTPGTGTGTGWSGWSLSQDVAVDVSLMHARPIAAATGAANGGWDGPPHWHGNGYGGMLAHYPRAVGSSNPANPAVAGSSNPANPAVAADADVDANADAEASAAGAHRAAAAAAACAGRTGVMGPAFIAAGGNKGAEPTDVGAVPYCQCTRGKQCSGPGCIPSFDFGVWPAAKGWSVFPASCGDRCGCDVADTRCRQSRGFAIDWSRWTDEIEAGQPGTGDGLGTGTGDRLGTGKQADRQALVRAMDMTVARFMVTAAAAGPSMHEGSTKHAEAGKTARSASTAAGTESHSPSHNSFKLGAARPSPAPPRWLFQKWNNRSTVPSKVYLQAARHAPGHTHVVLDEDDANAYMAGTAPATAAKYRELRSMAHRADLLRYCLLLHHGGIYLDIDMVLIGPISKAFPSLGTPTPATQTALGAHGGAFQAVLSFPAPGSPFMRSIVDDFVATPLRDGHPRGYLHFTQRFEDLLHRDLGGRNLTAGLTVHGGHRWDLLQEVCVARQMCEGQKVEVCGGRWDKHKYCCWVETAGHEVVMLSRDADYPGGYQ